jgi:hypothetical protein
MAMRWSRHDSPNLMQPTKPPTGLFGTKMVIAPALKEKTNSLRRPLLHTTMKVKEMTSESSQGSRA